MTTAKTTITRVFVQGLLTRDDIHIPLFFKSNRGQIFRVYNPDVEYGLTPTFRLLDPTWRLVVAPSYDGCVKRDPGVFVRTMTQLVEWLLKFKSVKWGETYIDLIDV
jgi:hypothetical protein